MNKIKNGFIQDFVNGLVEIKDNDKYNRFYSNINRSGSIENQNNYTNTKK